MSRFVLTAQLQLQAPSNVKQVVQQIQNQLNNVQVNVQVQGAQQAQRQINQVTASTNDAANAATRLGRSFGLSIKRFAAFSIATRAVSLFTSTLSKAVEESIAFERELIKISQVTGKTLGQLRDLTSEITRLSTGLGVSSTSLLSVSRILSQAGLNADETRIALDALAKSELAPTFDDIQQTAEGVVAVFNQFEQGAAALEAQLGSINAVAGKFAVEAGDLISVVRRTGGVFKAAGGDLNELIALFTSVRATTRESAESIATGLRTIFTRIQRPETIEFLRQYGVELLDLEGKFVGPFEATKRLSEALAGLEQGDITFVKIAEELGGFRQIGKVIPLLQQFSVAQEALNVAQEGSGSLADDAAKAQLSLAVRINKVKEEFLALVRSITETTSFQLFANTALNLTSALIKLADALKPVIPLLTAFAGIKLATGVGSFIRGIGGGLRTPRGFASGGLVPGSGNRDTVPAMLTPGEFVIRKSSVAKLGAGNLAAMNENRYALGGTVGAIALNPIDGSGTGSGSVSTKDIYSTLATNNQLPGNTSNNKSLFKKDGTFAINTTFAEGKGKRPFYQRINNLVKRIAFNGKDSQKFKTIGVAFPSTKTDDSTVETKIKQGLSSSYAKLVPETANNLKQVLGSAGTNISSGIFDQRIVKSIGLEDAAGKIFEGAVSSLGAPFDAAVGKQDRDDFDFPKGIGSNLAQFAPFAKLQNIATDAKKTIDTTILNDIANRKTKNFLAGQVNSSPAFQELKNRVLNRKKGIETNKGPQKRNLGGLIQKFATGGEAAVDPNAPSSKQLNFLKSLASKFYTDEASIKRFLGQVYDKNTASRQIQGLQAAQRWAPLFKRLRTEGNMVELFGANARPYAYAKIGNASAPFDDLKDEKTIREFLKRGKLAFGSSVGQTKGRYGGTRTYSASGRSSYYRRALGGLIREFASGGSVGTDTVPALLTPGEFVINRSSAQKIGYGSLNRMNKVGKYAKGGTVGQKGPKKMFFGGIAGESDSSSVNIDTSALQQSLNQLSVNINNVGKGILQLGLNANNAGRSLISLTSASVNHLQATGQISAATAQSAQQMLQANSATLKKQTSDLKAAMASDKAAAADIKEADASSKAAAEDLKQAGATKKGGLTLSKFGFALSAGTAAVSAMIPPVDETSGAFAKLANSTLNMITVIGSAIFALSAFAASLEGTAIANAFNSFFKGIKIKDVGQLLLGKGGRIAGRAGGVVNQLAGGTAGNIAGSAVKLGGGLLGAAAAAAAITEGFNFVIAAQYDYTKQLEEATKAGNVGEAERIAGEQYDLEAAGSSRRAFGYGGAAIGAGIGSIFGGPVGAIIGSAIGSAAGAGLATVIDSYAPGVSEYINVVFGGKTKASAVAIAGANAAASKAAKSLAESNDKASQTMQEFRDGTASATDVIKASSQANKDALLAGKKADEAIAKNEANRTDNVFGRELGAYLTFGYVDTAADRNKAIDEENKALEKAGKKAEQDAIKAAMPGLQVLARETAATGGSFEDFRERIKATDPALAELLLRNGANEIKKTFENLAKEAEKTRKAFEAMNLGFQNVAAISGALSVNMANYLASQEAGYSQLDNTIRTLEASVTSAAQGISDDAFTGALANARAGLEKLGATDEQIKKFEENLTAINTVQKNYAKASEETKNRLVAEFQRGAGAGQSPEQKKNTFADVIADQLAGAGIGEEVRNRISDAIKGAEISGDDLNKILEGDLSVLDKVLTELGDKTLSQVIGPLQELAKYEQELVNITKKRLELENQVVAAQQNLIAAQAEAAEIIAKYGGPAFTPQMQTQSILDQANVQSDAAGVSRLRTGSAAELNQRSMETRAGLDRIATIRQQAANPNDPNNEAAQAQLSGESGVRLQEQEKRLQELAKSDYDTTKKLIQQKEKELQVIQEKNKAEKAAIDSLLAGDIDKWFEQQAAVGATAAIATGNRELMNAFGAQAVGMAAQDIKRQQDAGVTELYGQQLAGPGGLTERGYAAGLGMRGMSSPQAMAQIAAGTTAEEEAAKSEIRALAATLPNYAATQLQVAEDSLQTANIQYQAAEMQLEAAKQNAKDRGVDVAGMARGGPVYANRGIFVPRGTDTVPAMLTPGEFVVRRAAVQRGNNLQILQAMNRGQSGVSNSGGAVAMANGGRVRYLENGGEATGSNGVGFGLSAETVQSLTTALNNFNQTLSQNIDKLNNTNFNVKLDATNINVNLTGGSFLSNLNKQIQDEVMKTVGQEITNYRAVDGGKLQKDTRVV